MPFEREGDLLVAHFAVQERDILTELVEQEVALLSDLGGDADAGLTDAGIGGSTSLPSDPALARLLPDAYRDDPSAASEYRRLTEASMVSRKISAAEALAASLGDGDVRLSNEDASVWLRALNDLRLIIASRVGIENNDDEGNGDEVMMSVYRWLGFVQGTLLDALES